MTLSLVVIGAAALAPASGALGEDLLGRDLLRILDPLDAADPRADIRQVGVVDVGDGSLRLILQVEQYSDPLVDPAWVDGFTGVIWDLDTSGDGVPDLEVFLYNDLGRLVAEVGDARSGAFVCDAVPSASMATRSFSVTVPEPGCLGEVRHAATAGIFVLDDPVVGDVTDFAPANGALLGFDRHLGGQPAGGYTIVSRSAAFSRFGAMAPGGTAAAATFAGSAGTRPVVTTAGARAFEPGLWSATDDGRVLTEGGAQFLGDARGVALAQPIVGMAVMPDGAGYWLVARDGGIFSFGAARFFGSTGGIRLNQPIVGMAATPTGQGYWLVASDGGIFTYGDAEFHGSTGALRLNKPVVGMASGLQGQGYWLVASDGGIFSFGLPFHGSTGDVSLQQPIVGMAPTRSGGGYRFIARDGGLFSFGDAEFHGSSARPGRTDIVGLVTA